MRISESFEYPAPPDVVFAMMTDEVFQARKCEATHAIAHTESVRLTGPQTTVETTRDLPTNGFPDYAKSFVGQRLTVTETTVYGPAGADGRRIGRLSLSVGTLPVGVHGTVTILAVGGGTRVSIEAELKARVAFIGGKIEKAAVPFVVSGIRKERETGLVWLAEQ